MAVALYEGGNKTKYLIELCRIHPEVGVEPFPVFIAEFACQVFLSFDLSTSRTQKRRFFAITVRRRIRRRSSSNNKSVLRLLPAITMLFGTTNGVDYT